METFSKNFFVMYYKKENNFKTLEKNILYKKIELSEKIK
jgi:hypothetical protein